MEKRLFYESQWGSFTESHYVKLCVVKNLGTLEEDRGNIMVGVWQATVSDWSKQPKINKV